MIHRAKSARIRLLRLVRRARQRPRVGGVDLGDRGRLTPISRRFGFDRGLSVDRWYIERFLTEHAADIHGSVLEVADDAYTQRFGGDTVTQAEILHARSGYNATIVGDLATGEGIPKEAFNAIVLTQTLQFIFDVQSAIAVLHEALAPGGVLLATAPGISQISRYDADRWGEHWRFTRESLDRLLRATFGNNRVTVEARGNVKVAVAQLHGLAVEDLTEGDLEHDDPDYEVVLLARAVKQR